MIKTWSEAEREILQPLPRASVAEWADRNRVLSSLTSAEPGRWRTARTPYLQEPMDAFSDPLVEEIVLMTSTQIGKTECLLNMLGFAVDVDPGPALVVYPRIPDAKSISSDRYRPMLQATPSLRSHLPRLEDDMSKPEYHLDNMVITFQGANSPAGLSARAIRYLFMDELDKYPMFSGREADPVNLARERTRTFWNRKTVLASTPTTRDGYIYREYQKTDQRRYLVSCPRCGAWQPLAFGNLKWPKGERSPDRIREERCAWYKCTGCKGRMEEKEKPGLVASGVWVPEGGEVGHDGAVSVPAAAQGSRSRGYWINALYSPWLTWSEVAAKFLEVKGRHEELMNFVNSWLAEIWEEKAEDSDPNKLKARAGSYDEGTVPGGVIVLTAGVDVQKDHGWLIIRGWGYREESWLIRASRVETLEDAFALMFDTPYMRGTEAFTVRLACIDSAHRTDDVYKICRTRPDRARPTKGRDHLAGAPWYVSNLERHARTGVPIPGGVKLYHLDTGYYKDKITRMSQCGPSDPAQWHLFRNPGDDYLGQFCSEHKIIKRDKKTGRTSEAWTPKPGVSANHYWDCEVYAAAAAYMIRVFMLRDPKTKAVAEAASGTPPKKTKTVIKRQGGFGGIRSKY